MAKSIEEMLQERPVDPEALAREEERMLGEVRAYRLRELRERYELTQSALAELLSVTQKRVSKIEHGDIEHTEVGTLRRYAGSLGGKLHVTVEVGDETFQIA
ncbi:MAG TPA: XRE family transcriptional regulator [Pseudonocardiaceae bacterium]